MRALLRLGVSRRETSSLAAGGVAFAGGGGDGSADAGAVAVAHAMAQVAILPQGAPHCLAGLRFLIKG